MSTLSRLVPSSSRSELDSSSQYWSIFADQHWNEPNAQACHILRCKTAPPCLQPPAIVPAPLFWEIHPKPCAVKLSNDEVSLSDCFLLSAVRLNKYKIAGVKASIRTCMQVRSEPIRYALPSSTRPEWLAHNYVIKPKAESQIYIYICMCIYIIHISTKHPLLQCALRRQLLHKVDNNVISHKFSSTDLVFKLLPGPGDWLRIGCGVAANAC